MHLCLADWAIRGVLHQYWLMGKLLTNYFSCLRCEDSPEVYDSQTNIKQSQQVSVCCSKTPADVFGSLMGLSPFSPRVYINTSRNFHQTNNTADNRSQKLAQTTTFVRVDKSGPGASSSTINYRRDLMCHKNCLLLLQLIKHQQSVSAPSSCIKSTSKHFFFRGTD